MNAFIQQGCIKLIKSDNKDIYVSKDLISNKCSSLNYLKNYVTHLSNDTENSDLHHRNKSHFNLYSNRNQLF